MSDPDAVYALSRAIQAINSLTPLRLARELHNLCPRCWKNPKPCNCHEHPLIAADEENR